MIIWRYTSGGVQRSKDGRFEIVEHEKGFSLYDSNRASWLTPDFPTDHAAKHAAQCIRNGRLKPADGCTEARTA